MARAPSVSPSFAGAAPRRGRGWAGAVGAAPRGWGGGKKRVGSGGIIFASVRARALVVPRSAAHLWHIVAFADVSRETLLYLADFQHLYGNATVQLQVFSNLSPVFFFRYVGFFSYLCSEFNTKLLWQD